MEKYQVKAELLRILATDPDVRAAVVEVVLAAQAQALGTALERDTALLTARAAAPDPPEPAFDGPAWLRPTKASHGPHSQRRFAK